MVLFSFLACLAAFVFIGLLSVLKARKNTADYLLASQNTKPWLVALSAVATTNSGYMFVGQIGFTYTVGLHSIWLAIGFITGDFLSSLFVHRKLREHAGKNKSLSFVRAISDWQGGDMKYLRIIGGLITVAFLGTYAAAQLSAGSKALNVLFGWDYSLGAIIGAGIVVLYCMAGGIRASIWTDAAQSFVMLFAMILMVVMTIDAVGGVSSFITALDAVGPDYMNWFPSSTDGMPYIGPLLFVVGWVFAGIGIIGQPPIMVRFMAMDKPESMNRARIYYYGWYSAFYALTITAGLAARLLIPDANNFDAELALPMLAQTLLPEILVGVVLAGLFAATMSTADSQILCCTAAITSDLAPEKLNGYIVNKIATIIVTALALGIALFGSNNVFDLVLIAWSALGAAFAPLLILLVCGRSVSQMTAIAMMVGGIATVILWRQFGLNDAIYEILPGMTAGFVIWAIASPLVAKAHINTHK